MRRQRLIDALAICALSLVVFVMSVWVVRVIVWNDAYPMLVTASSFAFIASSINLAVKCANGDRQ